MDERSRGQIASHRFCHTGINAHVKFWNRSTASTCRFFVHSKYTPSTHTLQVSAPNGLKLPDGTLLPQGIQTVIPMDQIHYDESVYATASSYNAFRFCEPGAAQSFLAAKGANDRSMDGLHDNKTNQKPKSSVSLDDAFVSFGYGRHACPGRFFALYEMKLMLTHMIRHYHIQPLEKRPQQYSLMWLNLPSEKATIRVKRRA